MDHTALCGFHCVYEPDHVSTPSLPLPNIPSLISFPVSLEEPAVLISASAFLSCVSYLFSFSFFPSWYPYFLFPSYPVLCAALDEFEASLVPFCTAPLLVFSLHFLSCLISYDERTKCFDSLLCHQ